MLEWIRFGRNSVRKEKRPQKENSKFIPLPMLTDGPYSIVEVSSGKRGRRNDPVYLPRYISGEELESLVQGKVGRRIEKGEGRQAPAMWEEQSEDVLEGLSEVQALSEGLIEDPEDFWFDVKWTETGRNKKKTSEEAGCWWETDDC